MSVQVYASARLAVSREPSDGGLAGLPSGLINQGGCHAYVTQFARRSDTAVPVSSESQWPQPAPTDPYQAPVDPAPYPPYAAWVPQQMTPPLQAQPGTNGMSIASMVLGIVGLFVSWFTLGIPSILAVIFGHIGLSQTSKSRQSGRGMAVAGLATGYIAIGLFALFIFVVIGASA